MSESLLAYQNQILDTTSYIYQAYRKSIGIPNSSSNSSSNIPNDYKFPKEGPLTSAEQIRILESLLEKRTYLLIRTEHTVHSIGLWLLYGLPELVIDVTDLPAAKAQKTESNDLDDLDDLNHRVSNAVDIDSSIDLESLIRPIVEAHLLRSEPAEVSKHGDIYELNRRYDQNDQDLTFDSSNETVSLQLRRVSEDEYLSLNAMYLIWFYTYYVRADDNRKIMVSEEDSKIVDENDGLQYQLYPIYQISVPYNMISKLGQNSVSDLVSRYIDREYDDFSSDSFDDVETDETSSLDN
jgi:hypothetical protein